MDTERWLDVIFETIVVILRKDWRHAFLSDGLLANQAHLSKRILEAVGQAPLHVCGGPPAEEDAAVLFPKRRKLDVMSYLLWVPAYKRQKKSSAIALPSSASAPSSHPPAGASRCRVLPATFRRSVSEC